MQKIRILAILQIALGFLVFVASYWLIDMKAAFTTDVDVSIGGGFIVDYVPPSYVYEVTLAIFSAFIVICGLFLWKIHVKYAGSSLFPEGS